MDNNTCKIVIVGDAGTGKTCIITRFVNDKFEKSQMTTACLSFCTKTIEYNNKDKKYIVQYQNYFITARVLTF